MKIFTSNKHNFDNIFREYYGFFCFIEWVRVTKNPIIEFGNVISIYKTERPDFILETDTEKIGVEYVLIATPNSMNAMKALEEDKEIEYLQFHTNIYDEENTKNLNYIARRKDQEMTSPPLIGGQLERGWAKVACNLHSRIL